VTPITSDHGFVARLHRFERATGLYRPGRSPWVWTGPVINVVGSFAMIMWLGLVFGMGVIETIASSLFLSLFMGAMSASFLATWEDEAEEDERRAAEELSPKPEPPPQPGHGARAQTSPKLQPPAPAAAQPALPRRITVDEPRPAAPEPDRELAGPRATR
jgi:hypothetical protein